MAWSRVSSWDLFISDLSSLAHDPAQVWLWAPLKSRLHTFNVFLCDAWDSRRDFGWFGWLAKPRGFREWCDFITCIQDKTAKKNPTLLIANRTFKWKNQETNYQNGLNDFFILPPDLFHWAWVFFPPHTECRPQPVCKTRRRQVFPKRMYFFFWNMNPSCLKVF